MNLSDLTGHPVLDLSTARSVGRVDDFVIDPAAGRLVGFHLVKTAGGATWLAWEAVRSVGAESVTIEHGDMLTEPPPGSDGLRAAKVLAGRVLTDEGRELARLTDFDVDPDTGTISAVIVGDISLPASALIGIGCYAIIVADPNLSRSRPQTLSAPGMCG